MTSGKSKCLRKLDFHSLADVREDLDKLLQASEKGTLVQGGQWTLGQNAQHVGRFLQCALDGFPSRAPFFIRWVAILFFKKKALGPGHMPSGIKLPAKASYLLPDPDVSNDQGVTFLKQQLARIDQGERFTVPSPIFGKMTHDQWLHVQLKHAALHLGFLDPGVDE